MKDAATWLDEWHEKLNELFCSEQFKNRDKDAKIAYFDVGDVRIKYEYLGKE